MSTSALLDSIQQNVFRYGGPILIAVGSISCILNLIVFTKDTLRKNPCTMCLIVVNIINFIYLYLGFLLTTLAGGYGIDPSASNISFCRFRYYIALVLACSESSCLILASIDRTLVTSRNAGTRKRSTPRLVIISMIGLGLFWMLFQSHALIFTQILQFGPDYFVCYYQPGVYTTIMTYHSLVVIGILPPLLMGIFGFWTVKNIRGIRRVQHHSGPTNTATVAIGRPHALRSKDQQLIRMLFVEIITYVICKSPPIIFLIYQQITIYNNKSVEQGLIEEAIAQLTYFWYYIENCISCYTNILVSKTFRTELKRTLSRAS